MTSTIVSFCCMAFSYFVKKFVMEIGNWYLSKLDAHNRIQTGRRKTWSVFTTLRWLKNLHSSKAYITRFQSLKFYHTIQVYLCTKEEPCAKVQSYWALQNRGIVDKNAPHLREYHLHLYLWRHPYHWTNWSYICNIFVTPISVELLRLFHHSHICCNSEILAMQMHSVLYKLGV